jgi:hypothetical protein
MLRLTLIKPWMTIDIKKMLRKSAYKAKEQQANTIKHYTA